MNGTLTQSNVYYLPVRRETPEIVRRRSTRDVFARMARAWWRLRFASAEVWGVVRRNARHLFAGSETLVLDHADLQRCRPRLGPAQVIDFELAKVRLRAAAR